MEQDDIEGRDLADLVASQAGPFLFNGVDFSGQNLARINLRSARFKRCLFANCDFTAAKLEATQWLNCRAAQAVFVSATLTDAKFLRCDLNNSKWSRRKLAHANFEGCKLTGANFADVSSLGLNFNDELATALKIHPSSLFTLTLAAHEKRTAREVLLTCLAELEELDLADTILPSEPQRGMTPAMVEARNKWLAVQKLKAKGLSQAEARKQLALPEATVRRLWHKDALSIPPT